VYVLGGVVDESVDKDLTQFEASEIGLCTVRLPIPEYVVARASNPGHVNLSINQVLGILLLVQEDGDWGKAFTLHIPRRKGYTFQRTTELEQPSHKISTIS